jgi:hypothetical protein
MRRVVLAFAVCLAIQLILPRPAHAWWGWWDELSGAGPFTGFELEARLVCFGEVTSHPGTDGSLALVQRQFAYEISELTANPDNGAELIRRVIALNALLGAAVSEAVTTNDLAAIANEVVAFRSALGAQVPLGVQGQVKPLPPAVQRLDLALRNLQEKLEPPRRRLEVLKMRGGSAGVAFSACPIRRDINRRVSINTTFRLMHTYGERKAQYAGGNEIQLAMFVPTVSWRPLADLPSIDIIDVSAGAGFYWFTAEAGQPGSFEPFSGVVLEPIRIDFHFPSSVTREGWAGAVLAGLSYRRGRAIFPAGFKANAFGATTTPQQAQQISAEWVKNAAIFWDFAPLIHHWVTRRQ